MMERMSISGNNYYINSRRPFTGHAAESNDIDSVIKFAYEMCFGKGHHRDYRTGGSVGGIRM